MCWECNTCRRNATSVEKTLRKRLNATPVEEAAKRELECDPCLGNATWGLRFLRFGHLIGNLKGIKIYVFYRVILTTELLVEGCLWRFAWFFSIYLTDIFWDPYHGFSLWPSISETLSHFRPILRLWINFLRPLFRFLHVTFNFWDPCHTFGLFWDSESIFCAIYISPVMFR